MARMVEIPYMSDTSRTTFAVYCEGTESVVEINLSNDFKILDQRTDMEAGDITAEIQLLIINAISEMMNKMV